MQKDKIYKIKVIEEINKKRGRMGKKKKSSFITISLLIIIGFISFGLGVFLLINKGSNVLSVVGGFGLIGLSVAILAGSLKFFSK